MFAPTIAKPQASSPTPSGALRRRGGSSGVTVTLFARFVDGKFDPLTELGGPLLQSRANSEDCQEEIPPEANVIINRVTRGWLGYGLIEAIDDDDIIALENEKGEVSGRVHWTEALENPGVLRPGRFGWKGQLPSILSFAASASVGEMGFTNRLVMQEADQR